MDKLPPELSALYDIQVPAPVASWPWAPGWYGLFGLLLILGGLAAWRLLRYVLHGRAKRQALRLLDVYQQQYQQSADGTLACAHVSELLKRVALAYFPRQRVAGLQGEAWLRFLEDTGKNLDFQRVRFELLEQPYASCAAGHPEQLFMVARCWISQRRAPCLS